MNTAHPSQVAETAYTKWPETVSARYADRSFVARNRSGVKLDPVYWGQDAQVREGFCQKDVAGRPGGR